MIWRCKIWKPLDGKMVAKATSVDKNTPKSVYRGKTRSLLAQLGFGAVQWRLRRRGKGVLSSVEVQESCLSSGAKRRTYLKEGTVSGIQSL